MATLIIHPGMHKTGTSSVQETLARLPAERGAAYLMLDGNPNASPALDLAFMAQGRLTRNGQTWSEQRAQRRVVLRQRFAERCESLREQNAVLSAEGLQRFSGEELEGMLGHVRHAQVRFLVYMREPYGSAVSRVQQTIKGGSFKRWDLRSAAPSYRLANEKFQRYDTEFIPYDRRLLHEGCVVQDFCRRVGVKLLPGEVRSANESINRTVASLLYCRNVWRAGRGLPRAHQAPLVHLGVFRDVPGGKFMLHPALLRMAVAMHEAEVEWAARLMPPGWADEPAWPESADYIASEQDLLQVPPEGLEWLSLRVGRQVAADPAQVGEAANALLENLERQLEAKVKASRAAAARKAPQRFSLPV